MFATPNVALVTIVWLPLGMLATASMAYFLCRKVFHDRIVVAAVVAIIVGLIGPYVGMPLLVLLPWVVAALFIG